MRRNHYQYSPEVKLGGFKNSAAVTKGHYFYIRKKMEETIDDENPEIAKRIVKARGSIDLNKSNRDFWESRQVLKRLERFPIAKRMEEYS